MSSWMSCNNVKRVINYQTYILILGRIVTCQGVNFLPQNFQAFGWLDRRWASWYLWAPVPQQTNVLDNITNQKFVLKSRTYFVFFLCTYWPTRQLVNTKILNYLFWFLISTRIKQPQYKKIRCILLIFRIKF